MLLAVVSPKGSPGASTTALAMTLCWPRPVILAELDPRGGDVLWGYGRGQNFGPGGLLRLQLASRNQPMAQAVWNEVVALPGAEQRWVLPGLLAPREAGSVNWVAVARALGSLDGVDVIADVGPVFAERETSPQAVWAAADLVALAVRPTLAGVHNALNAAVVLRQELMAGGLGADRLVSFVVGCARGYPSRQVGAELAKHAPLVEEILPFDPESAEVLGGLRDQRQRFGKTPLLQGAHALALTLGGRAELLNRLQRPTPTSSAPTPPQNAATKPSDPARPLLSSPAVDPRRRSRRDPAPMHLQPLTRRENHGEEGTPA